ncbi:MAG TPA: hypothetical protein PKM35_08190 [Holophaga sp.]|nr:hypothetical protein [Holophaga sp.]HPS67637.1 hypothetical protein [Holophaga sp.]
MLFAIIFLAMSVLFAWFVYQAVITREILARGWGFRTRIYNRDDQPVYYWTTFACYLICAAWALIISVLLIRKSLF